MPKEKAGQCAFREIIVASGKNHASAFQVSIIQFKMFSLNRSQGKTK